MCLKEWIGVDHSGCISLLLDFAGQVDWQHLTFSDHLLSQFWCLFVDRKTLTITEMKKGENFFELKLILIGLTK
jgi:hypothetical protein